MAPPPSHLLRSRAGRILALVQLMHALAQGITLVVFPWWILESGGSLASAGLVLTASFAPFVVLGLPAGLVGDRLPRRSVFAVTLALQIVISVALWVGAAGTLSTWVLFGAAFWLGCGRVFLDAAMFGALGAVVPESGMLSAQATIGGAYNLGYYGGPAAGGALIALLGTRSTLAIMVVALAIALVSLIGLTRKVDVRSSTGRSTRALEGLRLVFTEPTLRALAFVSLAWSLLASGVVTLAVPHLRGQLGFTGGELSVVMTAGVIAMMVAPIVLHRLGHLIPDTRILVLALAGYLVPAIVFSIVDNVVLAALTYGPMMACTATCAATIIGARARRTPLHLQALAGVSGRMLAISGFTVGSAVASAATAWVAPSQVYQFIGVGMALLSVAALGGLDGPAQRRTRVHHVPASEGSG